MPSLITPKALARTYNHPSKDPWTAVELYREASKKPDDWGAQRVASAINSDQSNGFDGISRGEVRAWVDDDSKPDAARAVDVARELGWDADEWTETVRALAQLVIGIYAFGSINERHRSPSWSPDDPDSEAAIEQALEQVGVGYQHVDRDDPGQGDEIRPASHASRLGRALVVAGAPIGDKNARSVYGLPDWVDDAPMVVKVDLAVLLVRGRAITYPEKATRRIQSDRGAQYFRDVARLIEDATGATANASESGVTISADAVRELGLA
ncbi:hypothetical protein PNQ29_14495 [Halobacterium salinarum]|uniref:hypothetical protein n=1 Tax=Halobacterium salinarum TaxID=2242 RepID=UPI0025530ECE|nr:hypothetical protein [Halobacterium salinarum]MDL0119408.1 hypothetical protein [Halobacterium salinarum]MDL0120933.1 hypothetical protein [Halobacterium salinarum]MDL0145553.1 hypothetical protein [Halobacterium salinarum]